MKIIMMMKKNVNHLVLLLLHQHRQMIHPLYYVVIMIIQQIHLMNELDNEEEQAPIETPVKSDHISSNVSDVR